MLPITILTADDHPIVREGIAALIATQADMTLVAEAADGHAAVECWLRHRPDVTLMDLQMPDMNGIEAIRAIRQIAPTACIVVLTTYDGDVKAVTALKAGATAFLLKTMLRQELFTTIRAAHAGRRHVPAPVAAAIAEHVGHELLSDRELQVLLEVANGSANRAVAARLGITDETVKAHMKSILAKLNARDRTHAVAIAIKRGIIDL